jgi:hypothetical protein
VSHDAPPARARCPRTLDLARRTAPGPLTPTAPPLHAINVLPTPPFREHVADPVPNWSLAPPHRVRPTRWLEFWRRPHTAWPRRRACGRCHGLLATRPGVQFAAAEEGYKSVRSIYVQDHIIAERKRWEKINQHFIELCTVIPNLKKVLIQPTLSLSPATYIICYFVLCS